MVEINDESSDHCRQSQLKRVLRSRSGPGKKRARVVSPRPATSAAIQRACCILGRALTNEETALPLATLSSIGEKSDHTAIGGRFFGQELEPREAARARRPAGVMDAPAVRTRCA